MLRRAIGWAMVVGLVVGLAASAGAAGPGLDEARSLLKVGKYAEAIEALDTLAKAEPPPKSAERDAIALARAEGLESTGEPVKAIEALREAIEAGANAKPDDPKAANPDLWARLAENPVRPGRLGRRRGLGQGRFGSEARPPARPLGRGPVARSQGRHPRRRRRVQVVR